jgi:hypothetical protein
MPAAIFCAGGGYNRAMAKDQGPAAKLDDLRRRAGAMLAACEKKGAALGISGTEYMVGIMEGRFPRVTDDDLKAATQQPPDDA